MKKLIPLVAIVLIGLAAFAQKEDVSKLEITGLAQLSVMPVETIFSLTVNVTDADFGKALDDLNNQVKALKDALKKADVPEKSIKTNNYSINENYKYVNGRRNMDGYRAVHSMNVHVPFEKDKMKEVYAAIRKSEIEVNLRLSFGLSDRIKFESELMQMAVTVAKQKADLLANAAGLKVVGIKKMTYGSNRNHYQPRAYNMAMDASLKSAGAEANIDVNPGSIKLSDQVFIVFLLSEK